MKQHAWIIFYLVVSLLFFADLCLFALLERPFLHCTLSFFILLLFGPCSWIRIITVLLALCLEPFIYYGKFGITLLYLLPLTIGGHIMAKTLYPAWWYPYGLLAGALLIHTVAIEFILLHFPIGVFYTISLICANILIMFILSLKQLRS